MSDKPKRFQEWEEVDCNDCEHYWDNSCDAVGDARRTCTSYKATRKVVIPQQIKSLEKCVKCLAWSVIALCLSVLFHYLSHAFGW